VWFEPHSTARSAISREKEIKKWRRSKKIALIASPTRHFERRRPILSSLSAPPPTPSFRTEQADFFFRFRSCESVGPRREKSLFFFHRPAQRDLRPIAHVFLSAMKSLYRRCFFCTGESFDSP
jgi:hypothetical protein